MKNINDLAYPVDLPADVAGAMSTGRSSLVPKRALTAGESVQVLALVQCLMDTNEALQRRLESVERAVEQLTDNLKGAHRKALSIMNLIDGGNRDDGEDD
jgi:hypothetical protein